MAKNKTEEVQATDTAEQTQEQPTRRRRQVSAEVQARRAQRKAEKQQAKAEAIENRTKHFGRTEEEVVETQDKMFGVLRKCVEKEPAELNDTEKAALALMHVCFVRRPNEDVHWKDEFIPMYNSELLEDNYSQMYASLYSDPYYEVKEKGAETAGFNLRKQLHLAQGGRRGEKFERHPLRLTQGTVVANTKIHRQERERGIEEPRQRLTVFRLPEPTMEMLRDNIELVEELEAKYFKAA